MAVEKSLSLANPSPRNLGIGQKVGLALVGLGLLLLIMAMFGGTPARAGLVLALALGSLAIGGLSYAWFAYMNKPAGIQNNGVWQFGESGRGAAGWVLGIVLTLFYVALYWFPEWLGQGGDGNQGLVALFDPLSYLLKGQAASQWFVYGTLYTLAILVLGMKFIWKYRHNRYQIIRTLSVMFFQLGFAFLIPEILLSLNNTGQFSNVPYNDFKNMWPLNYYFFDSYNLNAMLGSGSGNLGLSMLIWGIAMIFVVSPFLTYFFGKRWYCSWVCGCGGLAETAGDPFRHLSDKSLSAWRFERWIIHGVLLFATLMTIAVIFSFYQENGGANFWISKEVFVWGTVAILLGLAAAVFFLRNRFQNIQKNIRYLMVGLMAATAGVVAINYLSGANHVLFVESYSLRKWYGFFIGATFSGVIGVGFYPLLGSRVWCRYGCPMAAILGLQQRFFSRFRITTNGGQCISCGNCSTYCEMGIDVRAYAQKGQNIVRASCVGCGICAAVCPRGVLRLENGPNTDESRMEEVRY